jgi:raffinose/stachyose/melibiose transport system substrate-binding protein
MKKILSVCLVLAVAAALSLSAQSTITLKMGDNLTNRTTTWGAVVEKINAEFKEANPGVEIVTESYQDQPYQQKIMIYATAKQLPDVFKYWSFSSMLKPFAQGGFVAPLNKADFDKFGYMAGSLESNMVDGKLYGIPVSADMWVVYYNKAIFKDAGITKLPATIEELKALAPKFKAKGIIPMTTDGKDAWPLSITFDQLAFRISGDATLPQKALDRKIKFTDPVFVRAAKELQDMTTKSGLFQEDLMVSGYGDSRNLFGQGKAAMYLMGSWELGLGTDTSFSDDFHANVDAFSFPFFKNGKGKTGDLMAWFGGNYVISASSKNKDLDLKYLKYYAEKFPAYAWETQSTFPAQKVAPRDSDTQVAKTLLKIAGDAKVTSGTASLDLSTAQFKDDNQNFIRELCSGLITPEVFCQKLDASADKASKQK